MHYFLTQTLPRLTRGQRVLIAGAAGAMVSAGLPPLYLLPLVYLGFTLQILLIISAHPQRELQLLTDAPTKNVAPKHIFLENFVFGFVYSLIAFHWVILSMLVNPTLHAWMAPIALPGLAAIIGCFIAGALSIAALIRGHYAQYCALVVLLALSEWLRGQIFPWNNFAQSFGVNNALLQPLALLGRDAFGIVVIASLCFPAYALTKGRTSKKHRICLAFTALAVPIIFAVWGAVRLDQAPNPQQNYWANAGIRLVQPNIAQADKMNPEKAGENLTRLVDLSFDNLPGWVTHIVWPEVALYVDITRYPNIQRDLGRLLPTGGVLLSGTLREENNRWYNSLVAIDSNGALEVVHDKVRLVPFGEFMPIPFLSAIAGISGASFQSGTALKSYRTALLPYFTSLICFEVVFSGDVTAADGKSLWMLNVTNDAWFGHSSGPYQHLGIARWRAIEQGIPLVRVANTGISAVYDAYGRELASRGLGEQGTINFRLPKPLPSRPLWLDERDTVTWVLLLLFSVIGVVLWLKEVKPKLRFEL